ncbi:MAG: hypothetical protein UE295_05035 [Acutalibacteraceae bacterium]|nr:hypothetical protein [Acutalibacteraceae bacterium]
MEEALKEKDLYCGVERGRESEYAHIYFVWAYDIDEAYEELGKVLDGMGVHHDEDVRFEYFCFSVEADNLYGQEHNAVVDKNGGVSVKL